ncbi:NAD(P)/FAD-dependent oxidoreductase [Amycolatopsis endophytica]|uniref:Halogenation protein CepH n=1 Tax=Amycolatopsis endophytica TaxID=860233 RepID=A0A853BCY7_9PSEU|nr:FAD-dependent oxidoreductase [Amycolatopsis endophytica]NYI92531.1 halogenation protein CepH [Amycolatopsis endophytica]
MSNVDDRADVVVVGGGPAGSTTASLIAMAGHRVVLLEKEHFPRYQIGESLLPATIHGVCRMLGVTEEIEKAGFTVKRGGSFRWGVNPQPWNFLFALSPKLSAANSTAFQVERMKFDEILLRNAQKLGVDVREGCAVTDAVQTGGRVTGVTYTDESGQSRTIEARFVVDSSGNSTRLSKYAQGKRIYSDFFKNLALFGYFEGGGRLPAPDSGNILCAAFDEGWIWYIPLSDNLTSVGAVVHRDQADKVRGTQEEREKSLMGFIDRCDIVRDMLAGAKRVTEGTYGEIRTRKDYSYTNDSFSAPGIVLAGDAACFIDPVFSTGVHLATYSGLLAARSINSVLAGTIAEDRAMAEFEARYRHEFGVFYEFLSSFYDMQANEDSYFWKARKVTNFSATDIEAFVTLVGGVASDEEALTDAESVVRRFRGSSTALEDAVERTGTMQTESGERMFALFGTKVVRDVMDGMNEVQARGAYGENAVNPVREGGLVSTPDGLHWQEPATDLTAAP